MAKDVFNDKETKQLHIDGRRLCALMEILPSQVVMTNIKHQVQKLLTLKQATTFLVKFSLFFFFFPSCIHSLPLDFAKSKNFDKKKNIVWPKPIG
jgi:hypothetical protein